MRAGEGNTMPCHGKKRHQRVLGFPLFEMWKTRFLGGYTMRFEINPARDNPGR